MAEEKHLRDYTGALDGDTDVSIDFEQLLKSDDLEEVGQTIIEKSYGEIDFMRMDVLDKFIEFIYFKVETGYVHVAHMAYPTKRMTDHDLEGRIIRLLNDHMYPEIVLKLLKIFTRNINDADSNLFIAHLIRSEDIIRSIYDTFLLFKKDIFKADPAARGLNVKRVQQFSARSELKLSSPLDASARLKYILEYFIILNRSGSLYNSEDIMLSGDPKPGKGS